MPAVGFVANHLERGGGLELYELAMAEGLHERGWDVLVAFEHDGDLSERWRAVASTMERFEGEQLPPMLKRADVLYVHPTSVIPLVGRFGAAARIPVVAHLHLPPESLRTGWKAVRGRRRSGHPEAEMLAPDAGITRFLAVSDHTAALWRRFGLPAERIDVVHNGVDLDRFRPAGAEERAATRRDLGIDADAIVLGYVGRIDPTKGIEQLLDAFADVTSDDASREVGLVVLGEASRHRGGAASPYTAGLMARPGLGVRWLGRRSDPERIVRSFDLLVVPSQWDEPFGLVAIEAMASGVAVIAARRGGLPEIFGDRFPGQLVEPTAPELATAIRRMIAEPTRLAALGGASREHVEARFSLTGAVNETERQLLGVLQR